MKKKLFSIILSFIMVATMMPIMTSTAFAVEGRGFEGDPWILGGDARTTRVLKAYLAGSKLTITGTGTADLIRTEDEVPWNDKRDKIVNVVIDEGVRQVPNYAFTDCANIKSIKLPSTIASIGVHAFENCTGLRDINIPKGLGAMPGTAFMGCSSLAYITVDSDNSKYTVVDGVLYDKSMQKLIKYPAKKAGTSFTIPSSVKTIDLYAFEGNENLQKIVFPKELGSLSISTSAFSNCKNLATLVFETSNVPTLSSTAFRGCSLKEIYVPEGAESQFEAAANWSKYANIIDDGEPDTPPEDPQVPISPEEPVQPEPEEPSKIERFYTNANFGSADTNSTGKTFEFAITDDVNNTVSLAMILGATSVPSNLTIPATVTFDGVTYKVTSLTAKAFYNCSSLRTVIFPQSLGTFKIGAEAFSGCANLNTVTVNTTSVPTLGSNGFEGCDALKVINVPPTLREAYEKASGWSTYASLLSKEVIAEGKFYSNEYFGSLSQSSYGKCFEFTVLDKNARTVSIGTVEAATSVPNSVTVPQTITFDGVSYKITTIAPNAFLKKTSLRSISIPNTIEKINYSAFDGCTGLTSVSLPNGLTNIAVNAFRDCKSLSSIVLPSGITRIEAAAFQNCESLISIVIPGSVTGVGKFAFRGCKKLKSVTLNAVVPPADDTAYMAFDGCDSSLKIYIPLGTYSMYISDSNWDDYEDILVETKTQIDPTVSKDEEQRLKDEEARLKQEEQRLREEEQRLKDEEARLKKENEELKAEAERIKKETEEAAAKLKEEKDKLYKDQEKDLTEEEKDALKKEQEAKLSETKVKELVSGMTLVVRTTNQPRGIYVHVLDEIVGLKEIKDAGYKVVYDFYSTQQRVVPDDSRLKLTKIFGKTEAWYLNTAAKRGMRYYYKATLRVIDAKDTVIAKTTLAQARYGYRTRR